MVFDTHTHAWGPPSKEHPWVNASIVNDVDGFDVDTIYTADKLLTDMASVGVDEAVIVGFPIYDWRDNWYTIECVKKYDDLTGIVMIDPFADGAAERLREYMAIDGILGFRLGAICPYDRMWETFDPTVTWLRDAIDEKAFWEAARETNALVQVLIHVNQLNQAINLVDTYQELSYAFDHFAHADPSKSPEESLFARFAHLAEYDVGVKISEIPHRSAEGFPYRDMHDHVRWLLDQFGRERVIWGSDFPNVSDTATYKDSLRWLEHVDELSDADREWLTHRAYADLVRL